MTAWLLVGAFLQGGRILANDFHRILSIFCGNADVCQKSDSNIAEIVFTDTISVWFLEMKEDTEWRHLRI